MELSSEQAAEDIILVVDDNQRNLQSFQKILDKEGWQVVAIDNAEKALSWLMSNPDVSLILLDVQMPVMNGFDLAQLIRQNSRFVDIPLLFISAVYDSSEYINRGFAVGASDYLIKPVENQVLIQKVEIFIDFYSKQRFYKQVKKVLEQKNAELNLALEAAQRANTEKSRFLANMSHELRTPMHAISSFTSLAMKKLSDREKLENYLNNIKHSADRLTQLLNDLLDLSRLDSGYAKAEFSDQDISGIVREAVNSVSSLLLDKHINLQLAADPPVNGRLDRKLMLQVIINLLSNAIKFSSANGVIRIEVGRKASALNGVSQEVIDVVVTDRGIGIPADELEHIFDRFVQSSRTRSQAGGTGLGLSITKKIIEQHNGRIWAESPPADGAGGTAFHIEIPAQQGLAHQVDYDGLEDAVAAHQQWRDVIDRVYQDGQVPVEIQNAFISNEKLCSFGVWLDQQDIQSSDFMALKKMHADFHRLAGDCITYFQIENDRVAEEKRKDFQVLSAEFIELLDSLRS